MEKKITKATFRSFINKNRAKLFVKVLSSFDGMTDCVQQSERSQFIPAGKASYAPNHNLGIQGVWLVNGSRDFFSHYEDAEFVGLKFYNCCGSGVVAIRKVIS